MWLYMILGALVVLALLGGILMGGVFTIVLVPLAVIAAGAAIAWSLLARAAHSPASGGGEKPLPTGQQSDTGHVRTSPEALADARRTRQ